MKDIAIFGAGGFGREILTLIENINDVASSWNIIGFFDDGHPKGEIINGYPVLGGVDVLNTWQKAIAVTIAIGDPDVKKRIHGNIHNTMVEYPTLIHPSVVLGNKDLIQIGKGCILCAGNILTTNIRIDDFVLLNLACTVGHDTVIKDFSAFMPSCNISGEVIIEEGVFCGTGVKIINQMTIGENTTVGAGAVITKSLPANCVAVGMPARAIKSKTPNAEG